MILKVKPMPFTMIYRILLICNLNLLLGLYAIAQKTHVDFALKATLERTPSTKMIHMAAVGDATAIAGAVAELGGNILHRTGNMVSFRIPAGEIAKLDGVPGIDYLEFTGSTGKPLNDSMLVNSRFIWVHEGFSGWPEGLTGKDVVVGLVDTGIELLHPDFQHPDGSTRVKYLWDQTQSGNGPEPFGYGAEWNAAQIDSGITGHQDQPQWFGHGSTVSGTAAGNGLAIEDFKGAAPDADLVVVSSQFGVPNWTLSVADAVQYVFDKADELDKPCVVNLSLGTYSGSRDGLDVAALLIDSMISAKPGRVVVAAAGNSGNWAPYHLGYNVTADTAFTWFMHNNNSGLGYGAVFFELWADTADFQDVHFAIGADRVNPSLQFRGRTPFRQIEASLNEVVSDTLWSLSGNVLGVVDYFSIPRGGQYRMQVHMATPDSAQYRFRFITAGQGRFDVWSTSVLGTSNMLWNNLPSETVYPDMAHYRAPDKHKHIVGSWACSPKVITVGNYANRDQYIDYNGNLQTFSHPAGLLSVNSSHGPTRDERLKPEVSASGDLTLSTAKLSTLAQLINNEPFKVAQGGMHYRNGGTSMASPVVSGATALLLEMCPEADVETIRNAILNHTYSDNFTDTVPNNAYGTGKLDAEAAVNALWFQPQLNESGTVLVCEGDNFLLQTSDSYNSYLWNTGETDAVQNPDSNSTWWVQVITEAGCIGRSDTVHVVFSPLPEAEITMTWDTLLTVYDSTWTYQWYLNGGVLENANQHYFVPTQSGDYTVEVSNEAGCTTISEPENFLITSVQQTESASWQAYPNPVSDNLWITGNERALHVTIFGADGRMVHSFEPQHDASSPIEIHTQNWPAGVYLIRIETASGPQTLRVVAAER